MANTQAAVSCANLFLIPTLVVPPVSYHLKCEIVYLRKLFTRMESQGVLPQRGPGTSTLWKVNSLHAISKLQYVQFHVCYKKNFLYLTLSSIVHTCMVSIELKPCILACLQEVKNNGKLLNCQSQMWLQLLTRGGWILRDGSLFYGNDRVGKKPNGL